MGRGGGNKVYLGIDIGTSAVKAVILDDEGTVLDQASGPLSLSRPHDLWSEQAPSDWWSATNQAVAGLSINLRHQVKSIGLSGQMHGATLLDAADHPLRPAILWNDGRSFAECGELEVLEPNSRTITGNLAMPGFTAPKLLWVRKHEPQLWDKIATVLLPKDYVRLRMTGERATDLSDASGTLWVDVRNRIWSPEMLAASGLETRHMPRLCEGTEVTGHLRGEIAEAWGMSSVPVVAGAGDNAGGAAGVGVIADGDALLSLGTSGVIFVANDSFRPNPAQAVHAFCHCLPDRWHQMSVMLNAAVCVDWAARLTGHADARSFLAGIETGKNASSDGVVFLPYLGGERTPHNDPKAKGVFFGLTHGTDTDALAMAVLEGVAFAFADGLDALIAAGSKVDSLTVVGGGAQSPLWGRILASVLQRPLIYRKNADVGPALGAARLAQIAVVGRAAEQLCVPPEIVRVAEPDDRLAEGLASRRKTFRALYQRLKDIVPETLS